MESRRTNKRPDRASEAKVMDETTLPNSGEDLVALSEGEGRGPTAPTRKPKAPKRQWVWVTVAIACGFLCLGVAVWEAFKAGSNPVAEQKEATVLEEKPPLERCYFVVSGMGQVFHARTMTPEQARAEAKKRGGVVPGGFPAWFLQEEHARTFAENIGDVHSAFLDMWGRREGFKSRTDRMTGLREPTNKTEWNEVEVVVDGLLKIARGVEKRFGHREDFRRCNEALHMLKNHLGDHSSSEEVVVHPLGVPDYLWNVGIRLAIFAHVQKWEHADGEQSAGIFDSLPKLPPPPQVGSGKQ